MIRDRSIIVCTSIVGIIFLVALFVRIDRPLMWNDEADTAMYAQRITEVGYPKVHNGKHTLFTIDESGIDINKKFDAYVSSGWLQFYVAVPGILLARHFSDLYVKTAILRIPFALLGTLGVLLFGLAVGQVLPHRRQRLWFAFAYVVAVTLSVTLLLHLREVRYYSISILLSGAWFWSLIYYLILAKGKTRTHIFVQFTTYTLTFLTFYPLAFIMAASTVVYASWQWWHNRLHAEIARRARALLLAIGCFVLCLIPLLWFFRTILIANYLSKIYFFSLGDYFTNIGTLLIDFGKHELFGFAILLQIFFLGLYLQVRHMPVQRDIAPAFRVWALLVLFTVVYVLVIAKSPFFHQRYYLALYLTLASTIALVVVMLHAIVPDTLPRARLHSGMVFLGSVLGITFFGNLLIIFPLIRGLVYERTHIYQGPLDFVIPYIKKQYINPATLTVATNYEGLAIMYYLDSTILVGEHSQAEVRVISSLPDLIVERKMHRLFDQDSFNRYRRRSTYTSLHFPVADTLLNTIPETGHLLYYHEFKTPLTDDPTKQLVLEMRQ